MGVNGSGREEGGICEYGGRGQGGIWIMEGKEGVNESGGGMWIREGRRVC